MLAKLDRNRARSRKRSEDRSGGSRFLASVPVGSRLNRDGDVLRSTSHALTSLVANGPHVASRPSR